MTFINFICSIVTAWNWYSEYFYDVYKKAEVGFSLHVVRLLTQENRHWAADSKCRLIFWGAHLRDEGGNGKKLGINYQILIPGASLRDLQMKFPPQRRLKISYVHICSSKADCLSIKCGTKVGDVDEAHRHNHYRAFIMFLTSNFKTNPTLSK